MDLHERKAVLEALEHNLQSRLLAVRTPDAVMEHVERLRENAQVLLAQAQRIERSLEHDAAQIESIRTELACVRMEMQIVEYCLRAGIQPVGDLRNMMVQALRGMGNEDSTTST